MGAALVRFALAEEGSALTMRWAAAQTPDPVRAALYLRHATDERRHARAMRARARELGAEIGDEHADAEDLFVTLGERWFLAFVTLAERRGLAELGAHQRAFARAGDARSASVMEAIVADEARHARYARELLETTCGSASRARLTLLLVALWEAHRAVRRASAAMGRGLYFVLTSVLVVLILPPMSIYARWLLRRSAAQAARLPGG